jgi:hypothetical protein
MSRKCDIQVTRVENYKMLGTSDFDNVYNGRTDMASLIMIVIMKQYNYETSNYI